MNIPVYRKPLTLMPICLLSLPSDDLQYALCLMDFCDLTALSLCSKRTKNLVDYSNVAIEGIYIEVDENRIHSKISAFQSYGGSCYARTIKFVLREDSSIEFERDDRFPKWVNTEFTFSQLIAHFLSLWNPDNRIIQKLTIKNVNPMTYLDTVKQLIPECEALEISENCSDDVAKMAFLKLAPIAVEEVVFQKNRFDNENDISKLLSLNLKSVVFHDSENPFKLESNDLLSLIIVDLYIETANITGKELNRFLKLWMKGNHGSYRPKFLELHLKNELNCEEVLKGIKYDTVDNMNRLKRADGKELDILIKMKYFCIPVSQSSLQLMPIRLLSLPVADLQYALNCMDIHALVAFSLCSNRTKNLVKSSKRKIDLPIVYVDKNHVQFEICERIFPQNDYFNFQLPRYSLKICFYDTRAEIARRGGFEVWKKEEFTQSDWIAHLMSIFNESMIRSLTIMNISLSYLDDVTEFIPNCISLVISHLSSNDVTEKAFLKLAPTAKEVEVCRNIFDSGNDISKLLALNLKKVSFDDWRKSFKLELDDLLVINIINLTIKIANITVRELNRFLKLWMKGNHRFYRLKTLELKLNDEMEINPEEVFKGIKYEIVEDNYSFRLKRRDGKELRVFIVFGSFYFFFD
ncbi:hypothetical protein B9Z55_021606 [Caenorhabditis nigoni]|uniref:F-box domain-containing protein n=1 Tax=Caenorhabditis nigoni TaxID=1611254 RepID=A0A2G5TSV5_9PELO|nr:hypothetical protein B9Z55_021606 [Caenorhabditis nigoni]